ncbi:MAG: S1 RNA-binding domain-containing protein, partial [Phycisphaerales bacterium]|nr:S1 RNA-binding domain-containing protein [Phycisphaerales bacterium]
IDGLLHVSDMSWTRKVSHPNEMVKKGDEVECVVLAVDTDKHRIALGMKQLKADPWEEEIPERFAVGQELDGVITKITNFGVFVELDNELEGLLHISELSGEEGDKPEEVVKVGEKIKVQVIKLDPKERKIGLTSSLEGLGGGEAPAPSSSADESPAEDAEAEEEAPAEAPEEEAK